MMDIVPIMGSLQFEDHLLSALWGLNDATSLSDLRNARQLRNATRARMGANTNRRISRMVCEPGVRGRCVHHLCDTAGSAIADGFRWTALRGEQHDVYSQTQSIYQNHKTHDNIYHMTWKNQKLLF